MFGFLLKAIEKTRKRAAARAFCTGALAAVQPRKWAPLDLAPSNEKKHRHRHPPEPKKRWPQLSAPAHAELRVSLHRLLCLLLWPQRSCKFDGRIHKKIHTVAFEQGMKSGIICFSYLKKKNLISKLLLKTVTDSEAFKEKKKTEQKAVLLTWVMFFSIGNEVKLPIVSPSSKRVISTISTNSNSSTSLTRSCFSAHLQTPLLRLPLSHT